MLAESEAIAHDALEAIDVEYDPLPAVLDPEEALNDDVVIHDDIGTNVSYTWPLLIEENEGDVERQLRMQSQRTLEQAEEDHLEARGHRVLVQVAPELTTRDS